MTDESWYAQTAYGSKEVPQQEASTARPWIMRFAKARLPWGNTDDVTSVNLLEKFSPKALRLHEGFKNEREEQIATNNYAPSPYELIDFHIRDNHERFRYALLPASSHFWLYMKAFGKYIFLLLLIVSTPIFILDITTGKEPAWGSTISWFVDFFSFILGLPLLAWAIGAIVIKHFPNLWIKPVSYTHLTLPTICSV